MSTTAMVVDDSRAMRIILRRTLAEIGYQVSEAANGKEAMSILNSSGPQLDLILIDWNMPEMNGLELVRAIRTLPAYAGTFLMMVTTETETDQVMLALEAGANEYVMKPFTRDVIETKLRLLGAIS